MNTRRHALPPMSLTPAQRHLLIAMRLLVSLLAILAVCNFAILMKP